jgi:hypothetical protein
VGTTRSLSYLGLPWPPRFSFCCTVVKIPRSMRRPPRPPALNASQPKTSHTAPLHLYTRDMCNFKHARRFVPSPTSPRPPNTERGPAPRPCGCFVCLKPSGLCLGVVGGPNEASRMRIAECSMLGLIRRPVRAGRSASHPSLALRERRQAHSRSICPRAPRGLCDHVQQCIGYIRALSCHEIDYLGHIL